MCVNCKSAATYNIQSIILSLYIFTFWTQIFTHQNKLNKLFAWWHNMPPPLYSPCGHPSPHAPLSKRNVAVLSHTKYVPMLTAAATLHIKAALSKAAWWPWPFDLLESGVRVTCDVGYLCANFSLPRPLCSRVMPDVRNRRQTDVRQKHRLMPPRIRGGA